MELKQNLSNNMKTLRASLHRSLEEFSAEIGIGKTTLQDIEGGRSNATLETIETIAQNLGISPLSLLAAREAPAELLLSLAILRISEYFCKLSYSDQQEAAKHFKAFLQVMERAQV